MDSLEYIDDYFAGKLTDEQKIAFEARIKSDPAFSEEVAFYVNAIDVLKEEKHSEKRARFRTLYQENRPVAQAPVRRIWPYAAAASVLALAIGFWWFAQHGTSDPQRLADRYISGQLTNLPVTMSADRDSLQQGIDLYNHGQLTQARDLFADLVRHTPYSVQAKIYTGIVFLRLQDYDNSLACFQQLAADTTLYGNPALFYEALTLMKRSRPGDTDRARQLLQQVVDRNLDKKEDAQQLLRNW